MVVFILDLHKDWGKSGRSVGKVSVTLMAEEGSWEQSSISQVTQRKLMVEEPLGTASCKVFVMCNETCRSSIRALWPRS